MKYIVYLTKNTKNEKIYIGVHKTENPDVFDGYLGCGVYRNSPSSYKRSKTPFQFAVNKYGIDSFKRTTLRVFDCEEDAYELEAKLVNEQFLTRKDTYNATLGGSAPHDVSVEVFQYDIKGTFIKMWKSFREVSRHYECSSTAIYRAVNYKGSSQGYFWSVEFVDKLDITQYTFETNIQTVYKYNIEGELLTSFNSIADAARDIDVLSTVIGRGIKGGYKVKDFYYSLELFVRFIPKETVSIRGKQIHLYTLEGEYYKTYNTPLECARDFGLKTSSEISSAIRLGRLFKNYQVSLERVDKMGTFEIPITRGKPVGCYTTKGKLVEEFSTIAEAIKKYGHSVSRVLKGQQKTTKGFIFKFL